LSGFPDNDYLSIDILTRKMTLAKHKYTLLSLFIVLAMQSGAQDPESFSATGFSIQEILQEWQNELSEISVINPINDTHIQLHEKQRLICILAILALLFLDSAVSAIGVSREERDKLIVTLHLFGHKSNDKTWRDIIQREVKKAQTTASYIQRLSSNTYY
jgi:hypothetical protein